MSLNRAHIVLVLLPVLLFILAGAAWPVQVLILQSGEKELALINVKKAEDISFEYMHSIYHVWQKESYAVKGNFLVLRELFFEDIQAAWYYDSYSRYPLERIPDGYVIRGINEHFDAVRFALGHGTQYKLLLGNSRELDINSLCPETAFLVLKTKVMPNVAFTFSRRNWHEQ
ncbi:MAG: DUF1850 domain-containing protein [Peptococcaceae bacterium]|jgi:hypothetical protein|nr:DUF1850 domain-containing protein [Peptococcaceae bacterium]MDH7524652.1 DUF1850 domain-containing protein [Peptococcaceae bacterium]